MKQLLKNLYKKFPLKKEFFSLLKIFWMPSEGIYKHLHFKGVFKVRLNATRTFLLKHYGFQIENEIFWSGLEGGIEKTSIHLWIMLASRARVIIDVGANTGIYSLVAKTVNPQAQVYAFEPIKRVYEKLCENNELNNFNIACFEEALSNADGEATVFDTDAEHTYSVTVGKNLNPADTAVIPTVIKTIKLDTFVSAAEIKNIDLIKIDVETHEAEVIEGFGEYLEQFKPAILIEILNDEVGENVEKQVRNKGYLYFNINDKSGIVRRTDHIKKSDFFNYLLCNEETARHLEII